MKSYNGSISIYFTFSIILIISVVLSVTEISRINSQKLYLQIATDAGLDSMCSLYHRKLYEYYNLYGVEYRTDDMLKKEYISYVTPFLVDESTGNNINKWFNGKLDESNVDLKYKLLIADMNLENEIAEYMKYNLIGKAVNFLGKDFFINTKEDIQKLAEEANEVFDESQKLNIYNEIHDRYFNYSKYIKEIDKYTKKIKSSIDKANSEVNNLRTITVSNTLSNGQKVLKKIKDVKDEIDSFVNLLEKYKDEFLKLKKAIMESRIKYQNDILSGEYDFNDDVKKFIEEEFLQFEEYADKNEDIENKVLEANKVKKSFDEDYNYINSYVLRLESIEESLDYERHKTKDEKDQDTIDELREERKDIGDSLEEQIKELKIKAKDIIISPFNKDSSVTSHDKEESAINALVGLKDGILLKLVLPEEEIEKINNTKNSYKDYKIDSKTKIVSLEKILFGEYELDKFNYRNKELNNETTYSGSKSYEVEYLINGKNSDYENIKSTINKILLIRIAMNVLYIYKNSVKRRTLRTFVNGIFIGLSPIVTEMIFILAITAWGTAQAVSDVKKLLANKKVKLMHDENTWDVDVSKIIDFEDNISSSDGDDPSPSLSYKDYLRILLLSEKQEEINSRMANLIDYNLSQVQNTFDLDKLIFSFLVYNKFESGHFFTNFSFATANGIELYDKYQIKIKGYKNFIQ